MNGCEIVWEVFLVSGFPPYKKGIIPNAVKIESEPFKKKEKTPIRRKVCVCV